jgi:hypothetical protein
MDTASEQSSAQVRGIGLFTRMRARRQAAAAARAAARRGDGGADDMGPKFVRGGATAPFHAALPRNPAAKQQQQQSQRQSPPGRSSEERVFGAPNAPGTTPPTRDATRQQKNGAQVLLDFLHHINPKTTGLANMLFNRHPLADNPAGYRYVVNQSTEQSDLAIILRDLTDGRLYRNGVRLVAAPWANLLFGDSFAATGNRKQVHELVYRRSSCTCIICLLRQQRFGKTLEHQIGGSVASSTSSMHRLSPESAMANFTQLYSMPSRSDLISIGAEHSTRELEIGTLIRLQSRAQAKLIFTEDVRLLFGNLAYTGPLSHEALYRNVTTLGVNYYAYNKGKKSRKVYVQGDLVRLPVEMGVVKNGAQAMFLKEIGSTFVLYKPQVLSIYIGRIVFEGNSIGSFIETEYVCIAFDEFPFPALHSTRPSPVYHLSIDWGEMTR